MKWTIKGLISVVTAICCIFAILLLLCPNQDESSQVRTLQDLGLQVNTYNKGCFLLADVFGKHEVIANRITLDNSKFAGAIVGQKAVLEPQAIQAINTCQFLSELSLDHSNIDSTSLLRCASLESISELRLSETNVDNYILEKLSRNDHLTVLQLDGTKITDIGISKLRGCTQLQRLSVGGQGITGEFLRDLHNLKKLTFISMYGENVDAEHLTALSTMPAKTLYVQCKPSDLPIEALKQSQLAEIRVYWESPLDQYDEDTIKKLSSAGSGRIVLAGSQR